MTEPTHDHPSTGTVSRLKTKIHGVPAWGIGIGIAILFVVAYIVWKRRANAAVDPATASVDDTVQPATDAIDPSTGLPYSVEPGGYGNAIDPGTGLPFNTSPDYPVGMTPQGTPTPHTNAQWARFVEDELLALGDDPSLIANALTKYLAGESLSAGETGVINVALQNYGTPPEGVLPINSSPAPTGGGGLPTPGTPKVVSIIGDTVTLAVAPVAGATLYEWQINGADHNHTVVPTYTYHLKSKTAYQLSVRARTAQGDTPVSPSVSVTTK